MLPWHGGATATDPGGGAALNDYVLLANSPRGDDALPTIIRYTGIVIAVSLIVATMMGVAGLSSGYVLALGMVLYKSVRDAWD